MQPNLSPAVDFNERDVTQIIPTVTSAVGAIVLHSTKGPVNVRTTLTTPADLENIFGRPNDVNFTHWFTTEAFLKQSNHVEAVRIENDNKAVAGLTVGISSDENEYLVLNTATVKGVSAFPLNYDDIKSHEAKKDYTLGPSTIDLSGNNLYTQDDYHFYGVGPGTYYEDISVTVVNYTDFIQLIGLKGELAEASNQDAINVIASKYYNGTVATSATSAVAYLSDSLVKDDVLTPPAVQSGDWYVNSEMIANLTSFEVGPASDDEAILIVFNEYDAPTESYLFSNIYGKLDAMGNNMFGPDQVNGKSDYIYFFIGNSETGSSGVSLVSINKTALGGADQLTGDIAGTGLGDLTGEILTAWQTYFSNPEEIEIDILLDPDYTDVIKRYLDQLAKDLRRDCIAVLNVPIEYMLNASNKRPIAAPYTAMKNYVANTLNINSSYSAIYGNYFKIFDRFSEKERWVPASGFCAAVMAFTDFNDAQWFAPAGLNRGIIDNVIDIAVNPNKGQRDILYYNRINPIVKFSGEGIVIWGQKTLQSGATAFSRINVRRLFVYLEKSIAKMARNLLFEFNDDFTRSRFRGITTPFLSDVKARRGCYDYLVVCDETNNTPEVIDRNEFRAEILLKPTRVAEFIHLTFTAVGTGVDFTEVVQRA